MVPARDNALSYPLIFWYRDALYRIVLVVVVFFTLTDRTSTIPSNILDCQFGTWSAGQKKIRETSTKLL